MSVASVTYIHNRMYLNVASTIVNMHPFCDSLGCPSGMKSDATRILGSQRGFHGQGASLGHVLVQIPLGVTTLSQDHNQTGGRLELV